MRCSHNWYNAHVRLQAIEYLNISGLVIDFATSPVQTGNSFFAFLGPRPVVQAVRHLSGFLVTLK